MTDRDKEDIARLKAAYALIKKHDIIRGMKVRDKDGVGEFGYVSQTGHLIFYEEGCCNMQDSWAMTPENAEKAYFSEH